MTVPEKLDAKTFLTLTPTGHPVQGLLDASMCLYDNEIYIFGGEAGQDFSSEIFRYNIETNVWHQVPVIGTSPAARSSHTAIVYGNEMYIFGGTGPEGMMFNDICAYSFETHKWRMIVAGVQKPPEHRRSHTAVLHGACMYIFGGAQPTKRLNDTWYFDFSTNLWTQIQAQPAPPARESHSAVVYNGAMYIYGGLGDEVMNDMWELDFVTNQWKLVSFLKQPNGRYRHTAVVCWGGMYVFGGVEMQRQNDVQLYSFALHTWMEEKQKKTITPRSQHAALMYRGDMYVFGGSDGVQSLSEICRYIIVPPSTLAADIQKVLPRILDSQLFNETKAFPVNQAIVKARFPSLLPFLSPNIPPPNPDLFEPKNPLPLTENGMELLIGFINTGSIDATRITACDAVALLGLAHNCGSVRLKKVCIAYLMEVDLSSLRNLGEVMVAAQKFDIQELERKAVHFFVTLLPFSLSILPHLPQDSLLHYTIVLGRIAKPEDSDAKGGSSLTKFFTKKEDLDKFMREVQQLGGMI
ncbi:putative RING finger protein B [Blattamonas nauphoetae]|uniref:RING finger protein B n=1 Tax=Blattamonas nauphoetae TaxID=2049346 RepID=A0ABQ9Y4A7_9EUKA|nr:putative RING finger protein B [Blattamonas nauphoetae]